MKLGSVWRRITRRLTPPGSREPANESDPGAQPGYQTTLDKARLDAARDANQRIGDWELPRDDR